MATGMYSRFKYDLFAGEMDLADDALIKAMLLNNSHAFNAAHNVIGDVNTNELSSGSGYTTGGETLAGKAITQGTSTKWDATDVEWTAATFSAWHCVLWNDSHATDDLIGSWDFGGEKIVSSGTFKLQWHVNGIITLGTA